MANLEGGADDLSHQLGILGQVLSLMFKEVNRLEGEGRKVTSPKNQAILLQQKSALLKSLKIGTGLLVSFGKKCLTEKQTLEERVLKWKEDGGALKEQRSLLESKEKELEAKSERLKCREVRLDKMEQDTVKKARDVSSRKKELDDREQKIGILKELNLLETEELQMKSQELEVKERELEIRDNELIAKGKELDKRDNEVEIKEKEVEDKVSELDKWDNELEMTEKELEVKANELEMRDNELEVKKKTLDKRDNELEAKMNELDKRDNELEAKERKLQEKAEALRSKDEMIEELSFRENVVLEREQMVKLEEERNQKVAKILTHKSKDLEEKAEALKIKEEALNLKSKEQSIGKTLQLTTGEQEVDQREQQVLIDVNGKIQALVKEQYEERKLLNEQQVEKLKNLLEASLQLQTEVEVPKDKELSSGSDELNEEEDGNELRKKIQLGGWYTIKDFCKVASEVGNEQEQAVSDRIKKLAALLAKWDKAATPVIKFEKGMETTVGIRSVDQGVSTVVSAPGQDLRTSLKNMANELVKLVRDGSSNAQA